MHYMHCLFCYGTKRYKSYVIKDNNYIIKGSNQFLMKITATNNNYLKKKI